MLVQPNTPYNVEIYKSGKKGKVIIICLSLIVCPVHYWAVGFQRITGSGCGFL